MITAEVNILVENDQADFVEDTLNKILTEHNVPGWELVTAALIGERDYDDSAHW